MIGMAIIVFGLLVTEVPEKTPSSAIVLAYQGKVEVLRKGPANPKNGTLPVKPRIMLRLFPGDQIVTHKNASLKLKIFKTSQTETVLAEKTVTVGATGCQPQTAVQRSTLQNEQIVRSTTGLDRLSKGVSGYRARNVRLSVKQPPVVPIHTSMVRSAKPSFSWEAIPKAVQYRVEFLDVKKDRLWMETASKPTLAFPADQPGLKEGAKYYWTVTGLNGNGNELVQHGESDFFQADDFDREDLAKLDALARKPDVESKLVAAGGYHSLYCFQETLAVFEQLAKAHPKEPEFHQMLAYLYDKAGRIKEAKTALSKADALLPPGKE